MKKSKIRIGWSEVSLIPDGRRVDLVGQFYERISADVETPIAVTALAIECGDDAMVHVACDLVSTSRRLLTAVREALPDDCGFPKDKLLISAIHTHTSIGYTDITDSFAELDCSLEGLKPEDVDYVPLVHDDSPDILRGEEAKEFIISRIVRAACEAWESRSEGMIATAFGRAAVGQCRRVCYSDGSAKMWGDTNSACFTELESGNDSGIEMLFTYTPEKELTGVVITVACPAQTLEHNTFISSDYMGKVREKLKAKYGQNVKLLPLIAPAGDQSPRDLVRWVDAEFPLHDPNITREKLLPRRADPSMFDVSGCEKAARRIADEIFYELADVKEYVDETCFTHKTLLVDLPLRRVTKEEKDAAQYAIESYFKTHSGNLNFEDTARLLIHVGIIRRYALQERMNLFDIEMHVIRLHDIVIASNPFELFLNYGNRIRARSRAKQTFLVQMCCGTYGYLPTERAERGSHYSAYVGSGSTGHEGGEILVRKTLDEINKMFEEE